jgi:hypothetical protein
MNLPKYVTINTTNYACAKPSKEAKIRLVSVQAADAEIARLQQQKVIAQTAPNTYLNALLAALKTKEKIAEEKPKKPRAPRKTKVAGAAKG